MIDLTRVLASLCAANQPRRAESLLQRGMATATVLDNRSALPDLLIVLVEVRSAQGRHTEAATLVGAAQAYAEALVGPTSGAGIIVAREREAIEPVRNASEQALGAEEAALHLRRGRDLNPLEAFTLAGVSVPEFARSMTRRTHDR